MRQLRQPICEVAESRSADDGHKSEGGNGNAGTCIEPVQQQHKTDDCCSGSDE
jgi:hypothetical protein